MFLIVANAGEGGSTWRLNRSVIFNIFVDFVLSLLVSIHACVN